MSTPSPRQNRPFPFVCIEGIDGAGKTTTARLVAQALGGRYYKTPPTPHALVRGEIDQQADPISRFYFYLSSVCLAAHEIQKLLSSGAVVCDRYIYSTYAYHFVMDQRLRACTLPLPLLMPDLAVLLTVDERERLARLRDRSDPIAHSDAAIESNTDFLARVETEFRTMRMLVIDTASKSPDHVATEVLAALDRKTATASMACQKAGKS